MKKRRAVISLLCLLALLPLALHAWRALPFDTHSLVEKKYDGWSGVLRLWVYEGWPAGSGSLSAWLNACIARFEGQHNGVYIQPQYVDADTLSAFNDGDLFPPDMLLFPPGLLESADGLLPLDVPESIRPALAGCGLWQGEAYAVPVAMGGYMWALNARQLEDVPADWSSAAPAAFPPEAHRRWDAALLALCASKRVGAASAAPDQDSRIDLGLSTRETAAPEASEVLPCRLPGGFAFDSDAWNHFINEEKPALCVTQREVRRLQGLSEQGRGPDWHLAAGGQAFSDQILALSIVNGSGREPRQALCAQFAAALLAEESQGALGKAGAFSVTDRMSGYAASDPLFSMETLLRSPDLRVPLCFGGSWQSAAAEALEALIEDRRDSLSLWALFEGRLAPGGGDG